MCKTQVFSRRDSNIISVPVAVPTITGLSSLNQSSMQVTWNPVPDDRVNMKGRIAGYTVSVVKTYFNIHFIHNWEFL